MNLKFFFIFSSLCFCIRSSAQLSINTDYSPDYLVRKVLVNKSSSIKIENVRYSGARDALGFFEFTTVYNKIIKRGIILCTGDVFNAIGPNTEHGLGSKTLTPGDIDLIGLANGPTFEAAILEFDFISSTDTISFNYFFASEEYPEYVNKNVNDVFAFFLSSAELDFKQNLAVLNGKTPITVDNINSKKNKEYYIANGRWDYDNIIKWSEDKQTGELAFFLQYDGLTTLLHAGAKVIPGKKYHLKIAIADVGDRVFDSGIFIEAESFNNVDLAKMPVLKQERINTLQALVDQKFKDELKEVTDSSVSVNIQIHFDVDSFSIRDKESYDKIDKVFDILKNDSSIIVVIQGHADSTGLAERNMPLSFNRAKTVSEYLVKKGILSERIKYYGLGTSKPLSSSDLALNRRVEFIFKLSSDKKKCLN